MMKPTETRHIEQHKMPSTMYMILYRLFCSCPCSRSSRIISLLCYSMLLPYNSVVSLELLTGKKLLRSNLASVCSFMSKTGYSKIAEDFSVFYCATSCAFSYSSIARLNCSASQRSMLPS